MAQENAQPITSMEHIPASEHGRGFPPFDAETFASQLFWLALTFVALYLLMSRIALPRIGAILEDRRQRIEGDLAEAERLKQDSDAALAGYERSLAEARTRAQALAGEARQQAAAAGEKRRRAAEEKLNARIAAAEGAIAKSRAAAMAHVRGIAGEAAQAIVERLTGVTPAASEVTEAVGAVLKR
jgi:F-type H+-transporting ATPase subunit b